MARNPDFILFYFTETFSARVAICAQSLVPLCSTQSQHGQSWFLFYTFQKESLLYFLLDSGLIAHAILLQHLVSFKSNQKSNLNLIPIPLSPRQDKECTEFWIKLANSQKRRLTRFPTKFRIRAAHSGKDVNWDLWMNSSTLITTQRQMFNIITPKNESTHVENISRKILILSKFNTSQQYISNST